MRAMWQEAFEFENNYNYNSFFIRIYFWNSFLQTTYHCQNNSKKQKLKHEFLFFSFGALHA